MDDLSRKPYGQWPPYLQEECGREFKRRRVAEGALYRFAYCPCGYHAPDEEEFSIHWLEHIWGRHAQGRFAPGQEFDLHGGPRTLPCLE
jgi:hypothetical protein